MSGNTDFEQSECIVAIIDDEEPVRTALADQLEAYGCLARAYASAPEYLESEDVSLPGCILLDVQLPGMDGLVLQETLARSDNPKPIIFMTGHATISTSVIAMKAGAIDYLVKPFKFEDMIGAINHAFNRDREDRRAAALRGAVLTSAEKLTPRESEVMAYVADGLMNKQIAYAMGISEIMVKLHRGRMMKKMGSSSLADLVRKFDICKSATNHATH